MKFKKVIYRIFDSILVRSSMPFLGKIANKIRVFFARKISPQISKKAFIEKHVFIVPNIYIDDYGSIGLYCHLSEGVHIGKHVMIGPNVNFYTTDHIRDAKTHLFAGYSKPKNIYIDDYSWIGNGAFILKGVHVGKNCTVGAASVVTHDVPDNCLVVGNPGVIKKHYE